MDLVWLRVAGCGERSDSKDQHIGEVVVHNLLGSAGILDGAFQPGEQGDDCVVVVIAAIHDVVVRNGRIREIRSGCRRNVGERCGQARRPLDQLVDALSPDPPSRHEFESLVHAYLQNPAARNEEETKLAATFKTWIAAEPGVLRAMASSPRLAQAQPRARQLTELGALGLEA